MPNVKRDGVPIDENCPKCGSDARDALRPLRRLHRLQRTTARAACDYTRNLERSRDGAAAASGDRRGPAEPRRSRRARSAASRWRCKRSRFGIFLGCTGYPECKNIRKIGTAGGAAQAHRRPCPECKQGEIVEKSSRRGKIFFSCSRYPDCKFALWNKPVPKACPKCGAPFLVEKTTKAKGTRRLLHARGVRLRGEGRSEA